MAVANHNFVAELRAIYNIFRYLVAALLVACGEEAQFEVIT